MRLLPVLWVFLLLAGSVLVTASLEDYAEEEPEFSHELDSHLNLEDDSLSLLDALGDDEDAEEEETDNEENLEVEDIELDEESLLMIKRAESCSRKPRSRGCKSAKKCLADDRSFCRKNPKQRKTSFRCHRLLAMENILDGASGVSRLARDLVRRCGGANLSQEEIVRLRRVLSRKYIADGEGDLALHALQKCDLNRMELNQLQRVLRDYERKKAAQILRGRNRRTLRALKALRGRFASLKSKRWVQNLRANVGNSDAIARHWVKKITTASLVFDPCAEVKCPDDSFCRLGACWKKENYFKFDPCEAVKCGNGKECKEGICVWRTSCTGVKCPRGERCVHGQCLDKESCYGVKCPSGERCVKGDCIDVLSPTTCKEMECPDGTECSEIQGKGAKCTKPVVEGRESLDKPKKKTDDNEKDAEWVAGEFGECSKPCGVPGGSRTRSVICKYEDGKVAPDYACESAAEKPIEETDCEAICNESEPVFEAKPVAESSKSTGPAGWQSSAWSQCSKRCEGQQTRTVSCKDDNGNEAEEHACSGEKPEATQPCGRKSCSVPDYHTVMRVCKGKSWVHCNCPKDYYPITGGCDGTGWPHRWQYNDWNGGKGWLCGGHKGDKTVHVICARGVGACKWQTTDGGDWHRQLCPKNTTVISGGCNALEKPHLVRWQMKSGNGWLCGGWNGKKRTSVLCCDNANLRKGCKTFTRKFGDWGHITCPKGTKIVSGGCDADKPYIIRASRPINRRTWQCGGWGGDKTITVTCCSSEDDY